MKQSRGLAAVALTFTAGNVTLTLSLGRDGAFPYAGVRNAAQAQMLNNVRREIVD